MRSKNIETQSTASPVRVVRVSPLLEARRKFNLEACQERLLARKGSLA